MARVALSVVFSRLRARSPWPRSLRAPVVRKALCPLGTPPNQDGLHMFFIDLQIVVKYKQVATHNLLCHAADAAHRPDDDDDTDDDQSRC